jgi:hypothetical protein
MDFMGIFGRSLRARVDIKRSLRGALEGNQTRAKRQNGKWAVGMENGVAWCDEIWRKDNAPPCQIAAEERRSCAFAGTNYCC